MPARSSTRRVLRELAVLLALLPVLTACALPGGPRYLPASAAVDPYHAVRARAQQLYQEGMEQERQSHWREALDDYQQAHLWDPDNRQDIEDALSRMQARVDTAPAPSPTAAAGQVGMRTFESHSFPYRISYPQSWLAKPGGTSQQPIDTFVGQPDAKVAAMVMITEEPTESSVTLDVAAAAVVDQLHAAGINDVQIAERRQVGGLPAYVLAYHVTDGSGTASARQAIFITSGHVWHVVLLATPGATPDLLKSFDRMLDSLQLLSPAFPQA